MYSSLITVTVNLLFPGLVGTISSIGIAKNYLQVAGFDDELCDVIRCYGVHLFMLSIFDLIVSH